MKKILLSSLVLLMSSNLLAGDAGYFSRTCTSSSQRTVLTLLEDYAGMESRSVYTLVVDGMPLVIDSNKSDVSIENDGDQYLTIYKNSEAVFSIQGPEKTITIYQDPRKGTIAENNASPTPLTVSVNCKDYFPAP